MVQVHYIEWELWYMSLRQGRDLAHCHWSREWAEFIIQFGQGGPMKVLNIPCSQEVGAGVIVIGWEFKWLDWLKAFYPSIREWMGLDGLVELTISIVGAVQGHKWNKLVRIRGQI